NRVVAIDGIEILLSLEFSIEDTDENRNNLYNTFFTNLEANYPPNSNKITITN
ncbi:14881_t:CDS:1, partial [Gigaspora rosea]